MVDILDDKEWLENIKRTQRSTPPLKTSDSQQSSYNIDVTTFTLSQYMQGEALYAPDSIAYDAAGKNIYQEITNLSGDSKYGKNFGPATLAMLPLQVLAQQQTGSTEGDDGDPSGTTSVTGGTSVPEELQKYGNGKIPAEMLVPIGIGSHKLFSAAAVMFRNMVAAAAKDGVPLTVTDSYRSYEAQVDVKNRKGNLAATPGKSNHGWGLAVDMKWEDGSGGNTESKGYHWMELNASRYGWVHPDWAKPGGSKPEPWHWEYRGNLNLSNAVDPRPVKEV